MLEQRQEPQCDGTPGLAVAQHITLAPLHEVEVGEFETVERRGDRLEAIPRLRALRQLGDEQAQAWMFASTDAAAQLVKLADAEPVAVHHQHHRRVGNVDTDLDHGGADEDIDVSRAERGHHGVLFVGGQPTVHEPEPQSRQRSAT